ncbi:Gaa1-domain-containing protein [Obba rivulosa]|uniref:Gaa1-domain-containing protein n=1 Tax=Obba rivulosa TaxID=1052685 RepID=A0A8E2DIG3_9APHY|nr:Gaa1-domain-containing protein [Obba rivulosa]
MATAVRDKASAVIGKLKSLILGTGDRNISRIRRRRKLTALLWKSLPALIVTLLSAGYFWMLAIPLPQLGQRTYIDENALQPGQVRTYWDWADVHRADQYLEGLEQLRGRNASSDEIAQHIATEFEKIGIPASTQRYSFSTTAGVTNGTNAYAVRSSPRASGAEAMVISASWISRTGEGDGTLNLRGVSSVLALANFLKGYSLWAKDLVFVISDGYLDGMQAWITSYHGVPQSNMWAEPLELSSGVVWTALNIDYPGHSFSHLGVFFEGLNGRLPNQDLINSLFVITRHTAAVPVVVYDHMDPHEFPGIKADLAGIPEWVPGSLRENDDVVEYGYRAKNILRHANYQARGQASGVHGLLHQFRIDAITLFAVPAAGPHGFHAIGRIVESTLRTTNNLLERLHASFFFYFLVGTHTFLKVGMYLPSAVLISTALMFAGLRAWVEAGWVWERAAPEPEAGADDKAGTGEKKGGPDQLKGRWVTRRRPVLKPLGIMLATHAAGALLFFTITQPWFVAHQEAYAVPVFALFSALSFAPLLLSPPSSSSPSAEAPLPLLLRALTLCLASTVTSIISVLNFSLAASLALTLGIPLTLAAPAHSLPARLGKGALYACLALGWLVLAPGEVRRAVWNWEVLRVWFAPFVCVVYTPLMLQAAVVNVLPP